MKTALRRKYSPSSVAPRNPRARRPVVDPEQCDGCLLCVEKCPNQALAAADKTGCGKCVRYCASMDVPCVPIVIRVLAGRCDGCGTCVDACPRGAISLPQASRAKKK